jgi:hypothetical protein
MHALVPEFKSALGRIEIGRDPRRYAAEAQADIRGYLEADETLCGWGVDTVLIGSYARDTGIYPGKDVDVFTKLTKLSTDDTDPRTIFDATWEILEAEYGDRAEPQPRSVKIEFDRDGFEFSVDVVPAVRCGERWAIPRHDTDLWDDPEQRWVETDPEQITKLTVAMNKLLLVGGQGAYVPTVKMVRQARRYHRQKEKPGGSYFELLSYWAFKRGEVSGSSFAEIFASTLASVAGQLRSGHQLIDPVLGTPYKPSPDPMLLADAASVFGRLAAEAREAVTTDDRCRAGSLWRGILGQNEQGWCFPIPNGCDEHGRALPVTAVGVSRGSRERGGFA